MSFVRHKLISGRKYYYLVESKRVNGRVTQRVLAYLGRKAPTVSSGAKGTRASKKRVTKPRGKPRR